MTRLIQPAPEIAVELDPQGAPVRITNGPLRGDAMPLSPWVVDQGGGRGEGLRPARPRGEPPHAQTVDHLHGDVVPLSRWVVDQDWWEKPVRREYWKVLISQTLLAEIYQDLATDRWYLDRLYD